MIVDDSLVARTALRRMVEGDGDLKVISTVSSAPAALEALATIRVDVILLDLEMPEIGGLEALPDIIQAARGARILVVSSLTSDGAEQSLRALSLGAADTHPKPTSGALDSAYCDALTAKIRLLGRGRVRSEASADLGLLVARPASPKPAQILAIGASTGGIHALSTLLAALPRRLGLPILVTQHLPSGFMTIFARQLRLASGYDAVVAEDGMLLEPDRIFVAPGHAHMTVFTTEDGLQIELDPRPAANGCMPSVDIMFESLARELGEHAMGVVLSGMGRDGAEGAGKIVDAGGLIYAQDEASCAVWGMPRAVADAGLASAIASPAEIALRVVANIGMRKTGIRAWR
jgi:two-component system chemotaxis response regulator CheB